jgi:hypothetical protein
MLKQVQTQLIDPWRSVHVEEVSLVILGEMPDFRQVKRK